MAGVLVVMQLMAGTWLMPADSLQRALARPLPAAPVVLDARDKTAYGRGHVPGAIRIDWKDYRNGRFRTGRLPDDNAATARRLAELGVDSTRPVVVYGDAHRGWGEEGRIAWMLHYLGHPTVSVLDGGFEAWTNAGGQVERETRRSPRGHFAARPRRDARASIDDVAGVLADSSRGLVLDVRTREEWEGQRKYWEPRTGHMPGARHIPWTTFLNSDGRLRTAAAFRDSLVKSGVRLDRPILLYCTGGVRSAEVFWMLRSLGYRDVRNYDGSWYEWAFDRTRPVSVK